MLQYLIILSVLFIKHQRQQQSPQGAHRLPNIQQTAANNHVTLAEHRCGADGADGADGATLK